MSLEIILDDDQMDKQFAVTASTHKRLIENHQLELKNVPHYNKLEDAIKETIILYTGTFSAVKEILRGSSVVNSIKQKDILASAIASKGAAMYFGAKTGAIGTGKGKREDDEIDFGNEDKAIASSINLLTNTAKDSTRFTSLSEAVKTGYDALAKTSGQAAFIANNYLANSIKVKSAYFTFEGLETHDIQPKTKKKQQVEENGEDKFVKDPVRIKITKPVRRKDIQGNKSALDAIDAIVDKNMAYDLAARENPEADEGFQQISLIYGPSGTGKSMVVEYAGTKSQQIAEKQGIPFEIVKLQYNTSWQDGHVQILRHQLNYITQPDKIRLVIMEEADRDLTARAKTNSETQKKVIGEFLDLSNQTAYANHHNYAILLVSNIPGEIDPAIRRRAREATYECRGPETKEEKLIVLKNNLGNRIKEGYVQVKDWNAIGDLAMELNLMGSDLRDTSKLVKKYISSGKRPANYHGMSLDKKKQIIKDNRNSITDKDFKNFMYQIGTAEKRLTDADKLFRMD